VKKNIILSVIIVNFVFILVLSLFLSASSQTISVEDYIKGKFPSIFGFYLSSLEDLDSYEKEFLDLLQKLPGEEQEYYAKEVYKNGFSLELLKSIREGKIIKTPASNPVFPSLPKSKEESTENLPTLIKRIAPSTVIVFTYGNKGEFLKLGSGFFISQSGDIIRLSVDIPSKYVHSLSLSATVPEVGERIIVYGSPLGLEKTVSDGIISAIREVPGYGKLIQITDPISPGSSGSPVLNMKGEVIGIATFQFIEGQNLNFAIPSERIASLNLMEEEKTFTTEELFEQEDKDKKTSDYSEAYNKALYFIDKREYEKALPYLEIAIKTDISSLKENVYSHIGFCNGELGNYIKAIEAYKQVILINPNDANAYYNLSVTYKNLGLYKDAIEARKQAIRIDPNDAMNYYNLGEYYDHLGLYKDAIEAYKQAIRIDPDRVICAIFRFHLGVSYFLIGDINSALNEYNILKELDVNLANELFDLINK
jgi:tetratricopeptide (TPR) repeat protein